MRAHSFARISANGRLDALHSEPPLTLRRVGSEPDVVALCLVGSAAGPLAGDDLTLELDADADTRLTSSGASVAQGRGGESSRMRLVARVGPGAHLDADPGALIVAEGSRVDVSVALDLATDSAVAWHEFVVLGRSTDVRPGRAGLHWDVVRAGRPVLRQSVDSADLGGHRVLASALLTAPDLDARTVVAGASAVAQRIDAHTVLVTVLGADAAAVRCDLDALVAQFRPASGPQAASTADSTIVATR